MAVPNAGDAAASDGLYVLAVMRPHAGRSGEGALEFATKSQDAALSPRTEELSIEGVVVYISLVGTTARPSLSVTRARPFASS